MLHLRPRLRLPVHHHALGYLTGLFFLTDEHHSDPSPELFFPPSSLPPRAHPGELPSVQRPKLGSSSSRACATVINSLAPAVGRPDFIGEPPASGRKIPSPVFPGWAETAKKPGPSWQATARPVQWRSSAGGRIRPKRPDLFKFQFSNLFWYSIMQKYSKNCRKRITTLIKVKQILLDS
jgi:hypothetical protein